MTRQCYPVMVMVPWNTKGVPMGAQPWKNWRGTVAGSSCRIEATGRHDGGECDDRGVDQPGTDGRPPRLDIQHHVLTRLRPLGDTDEDVSSPESSLPSDVIAFPSLASAPDQHGATRATTERRAGPVADRGDTRRDLSRCSENRPPSAAPNRHLGDCVRSWLHPGWWPELM